MLIGWRLELAPLSLSCWWRMVFENTALREVGSGCWLPVDGFRTRVTMLSEMGGFVVAMVAIMIICQGICLHPLYCPAFF